MRKILPLLLVSFFSAFFALGQTDRFAYAVTDINKEGANWSFLRKIDLKSGAFSEVVLNGNDASILAFDDATKKQILEPLKDARFGNTANAAFGTGVAAIALALVWPHGLGGRSPAPFGHEPVQRTAAVQADM